jgi:hypothetical protein
MYCQRNYQKAFADWLISLSAADSPSICRIPQAAYEFSLRAALVDGVSNGYPSATGLVQGELDTREIDPL